MKKLLLVAAVGAVSFSNVAMANIAQPTLYAGAQVGYQDVNLKERDDGDTYRQAVNGGAYSLVFGTHIDVPNSSMFGGLEGHIGLLDTSQHISWAEKVKLTRKAGLDLLVGFKPVNGAKLYGKLGYANTRFKLSSPWDSASTNRDGINVGVGAGVDVAPQLTARLEWTQTRYESIKTSDGKITPRESEVALGLVYNFN